VRHWRPFACYSPLVHDALIVGSGAGGGAVAWRLAAAGWRVLVLEKGPRYSRADYEHETGLQPGDFIPAVEVDPHTVVTPRTTAPVRTNLGWIATCVGGGTVHIAFAAAEVKRQLYAAATRAKDLLVIGFRRLMNGVEGA
jgi:choline dehydrogenase-like flavoprotein